MIEKDSAHPANPPMQTVELTSFADVREGWRCPHLSAGLKGPGEEHFHQGTVMRLDGEMHVLRRKVMGTLLSRRGHAFFREQWLFPAANAALKTILETRDHEGLARADIFGWALRVNQQLAAAITGLDEATSPEGAAKLFDLMEVVLRGRPRAFAVTMGEYDVTTPTAQAALEARRVIVAEFYTPALRRRQQSIVDGTAAVEAREGPRDLLSLIAAGADPAWSDPAMGERDALFLLAAAVHTTSASLVWTLREVFAWLQLHPAQSGRLVEDEFILRAAQEALRLHPVVPGFPRLAIDDVHLSSGVDVPRGAVAILRSGPASTEESVFGPNSLEFDPDRKVPAGVSRFGLAFGMGTHMCFGMPIVLGTGGIDGSLVYLLKQLFTAGVVPDERQAAFDLASTRGQFATDRLGESYLVKFPPAHQTVD